MATTTFLSDLMSEGGAFPLLAVCQSLSNQEENNTWWWWWLFLRVRGFWENVRQFIPRPVSYTHLTLPTSDGV